MCLFTHTTNIVCASAIVKSICEIATIDASALNALVSANGLPALIAVAVAHGTSSASLALSTSRLLCALAYNADHRAPIGRLGGVGALVHIMQGHLDNHHIQVSPVQLKVV